MRWPRRPRSFRQQIIVLTAGVTAIAMLLLTLVLQVVLAGISKRDVDRVLGNRADALISSIRTDARGQPAVPGSLLEAGAVVYDDTGHLVAGSPPKTLRKNYASMHNTRVTTATTVDDLSRVEARPFSTRDGGSGVVIVTEKLGPYEEAERLALIVSLSAGLLATAAAAAVAAWATRRALEPVAVMAQTASDWSEHDLGRRFDLGGPTNEIGSLASTLDTLLDKVSTAIRSEQRLTSELAHELRTPLTTIQGMTALVLMRDPLTPQARENLAEISAASERMATTITTLLELARNESDVIDAAHCSLVEVLEEVTADTRPAGVTVSVQVGDARLGLPHRLAVRTIAPVVGNALQFACSHVTLTALPGTSGLLELMVEDDGPGVQAPEPDLIFEPGTMSGTGAGAGLGLAMARRIARSVGGDVRLSDTPAPGTRFVIRLPRA